MQLLSSVLVLSGVFLAKLCLAESELSFRVTVPQKADKKLWIYSNANDIVTVLFNAKGKMVDCDVSKKNREAVKDLFYQALAGKVGSERIVQDMDVTKLARKCKKFLRDMKRRKADDNSSDVKEFKKHQELRDGVKGTKWCKTVAPSGVAHNEYGTEKMVDKCCQQYHGCNDTIHGFRAKHGLFNYNSFKLPSCGCMEKFKSCLGSVKSHKSKHVQHLYFDVAALTCYEIKGENVCAKWNLWYTKCNKYRVGDVAVRKH